ncbi:serine/threonine protein kinase [Crinalium epipsammum PCC 9333]|uniref:non-specific serine/threonine protein kinase n=1 Tax=Crinalium epipsammum PCC 9333 TaxID=1173022 RepID=K9VUW4_9CYAN|nr:serine/threonine-protein kinase [Crinalium epipsammum]AFZ11898.1 serine/threonine protein kinase [Crinalium epipsammum PCC 9333]
MYVDPQKITADKSSMLHSSNRMLETILRDRYKILKQLGSRQFCDTYLAKDEDLPEQPFCVVKQLSPKDLDPLFWPTAKRLFTTEAEVLHRLGKHDQIPQLLALFQENQEFYLVEEFIEGNDLSEEIGLGKRWNEEQVIVFLYDILGILAFIHQNHVIHRDIKPSNLIRRKQDSKITIIDFGAAKQISPDIATYKGQTSFTVAIGTPGYVANEQANGNPKFNSDIYATGIIAIQALTGIHPLPKDITTNEIIWRNQIDINPALADILDKMVRYNFQERYQSADEVLQAIKSVFNQKISSSLVISPPVLPLAPVTTTPKTQPSVNKWSRGELIAASALFFALLAFLSTLIQLPIFIKLLKENQATNIANQQTQTQLNTNWIDYHNVEQGIKIKYPANWERQDLQNPVTAEVVIFLPSQENDNDTFPTKLVIKVEDLSKRPMTLDEYTNSVIWEIRQFLQEANIIKSSSATLAHRPAHKIVYSGKYQQSELVTNMEVWALKSNKVYIITYSAESEKYAESLETAKQMIKTFEID